MKRRNKIILAIIGLVTVFSVIVLFVGATGVESSFTLEGWLDIGFP